MVSWEAHNETSDAAKPSTTSTRPTRPEDESYKPPDKLSSMLLKGGSSGLSDELSEVPDAEMMTMQPMWTLQDDKSSGEVHGVAEHHEEAAGDDGGKAKTFIDETAAAMTANMSESTDASAPSQPSIPPEWRDGQDMTGNAGASVHQPNGVQTGSP